jgi:hypothetical protein
MQQPQHARPLSSWRPALESHLDLPQRRGREVGLCIAMLLKGAPAEVVIDYVRYHVYIGFQHLYLFFDDPTDAAFEAVSTAFARTGQVTATRCDGAYWERRLRESAIVSRRAQNRVFDDTVRCIDTEHKCRQNLVVEHAAELARAARLEWLLHQDIDEVVLPQSEHPHDFFRQLPDDTEQVLLANHEVVPETFDVRHWLRDASLFKVNPVFAEREALQARWEETQAWRRHVLPGTPPTSYFNAYAGSKAAVRLRNTPLPYDVHKFLVLAPFNLYVVPKTREPGSNHEPVILHYANCGFAAWRRKYANLGRFPDQWWGRVPIRLPSHLLSRDAVHGGDADGAATFYRRVIMGNEAGELDFLHHLGALARVEFVRSVLAWLDSRR